jgi:hypothetical protein
MLAARSRADVSWSVQGGSCEAGAWHHSQWLYTKARCYGMPLAQQPASNGKHRRPGWTSPCQLATELTHKALALVAVVVGTQLCCLIQHLELLSMLHDVRQAGRQGGGNAGARVRLPVHDMTEDVAGGGKWQGGHVHAELAAT